MAGGPHAPLSQCSQRPEQSGRAPKRPEQSCRGACGSHRSAPLRGAERYWNVRKCPEIENARFSDTKRADCGLWGTTRRWWGEIGSDTDRTSVGQRRTNTTRRRSGAETQRVWRIGNREWGGRKSAGGPARRPAGMRRKARRHTRPTTRPVRGGTACARLPIVLSFSVRTVVFQTLVLYAILGGMSICAQGGKSDSRGREFGLLAFWPAAVGRASRATWGISDFSLRAGRGVGARRGANLIRGEKGVL